MALVSETISQSALSLLLADSSSGLTTPEHPVVNSQQRAIVLAMIRAIVGAVVQGITSTAVVSVASVSGVQPGSGVSGTGVGTIL